mgnify:CR=1 FL=1
MLSNNQFVIELQKEKEKVERDKNEVVNALEILKESEDVNIEKTNTIVKIIITGDGFLRKMVRKFLALNQAKQIVKMQRRINYKKE